MFKHLLLIDMIHLLIGVVSKKLSVITIFSQKNSRGAAAPHPHAQQKVHISLGPGNDVENFL